MNNINAWYCLMYSLEKTNKHVNIREFQKPVNLKSSWKYSTCTYNVLTHESNVRYYNYYIGTCETGL